jgi:LysR family hydrogen peroxide-inducible transcriptional activator
MTFQQLQYIVALDETGSFTAAAQASFVTQPTLSAQVKKLEDEWGTPLFDRTSHPIKPTPTGERVVAEARAALDRLGALAEGIRTDRADLGGTLEIGIIPTLAPYLLPRILGTIREALPRVTLKITEALTAEVAEKVRRGRWDVGLVSTPTGLPGLAERPLFHEAFRAYLCPGHPLLSEKTVSLPSLEASGLLLLREGHCFRDQVLALCGSARNPGTPVQFESGSLDTLMRLVEAGHGSTLVPEGMVLELDGERSALVRPLEGTEPRRTLGALFVLQGPKAALVDAFLTGVKKALPPRWREG